MDDIPVDIFTIIISRLPIRSVLKFMSVSKIWCSLSCDDSRFKYQYDNDGYYSNSVILLPQPQLDSKGEFYMLEILPSNVDSWKINIPFQDNCEHHVTLLGFSNGFFCFSSSHDWTSTERYVDYWLYVCNPVTGQIVQLPDLPLANYYNSYDRDFAWIRPNCKNIRNIDSGFGWVPSTNEFKVVLLICFMEFEGLLGTEVNILTVGSKKWRVLKNVPNYYDSQDDRSLPMVFVNGLFHFIDIHVFDKMDGSDNSVEFLIISFDLEHETFGDVPSPNEFNLLSWADSDCFQIVVLQGCLSISDSSHNDRCDIWVMKEYNVGESWTKQFVIWKLSIYETQIYKPVFFQKNGEIVLLRDNTVLESYNLATGICTSIQDARLLNWHLNSDLSCQSFPYTPSLLELKSKSEEQDIESENEEDTDIPNSKSESESGSDSASEGDSMSLSEEDSDSRK